MKLDGPKGEARRVDPDRLAAMLSGDSLATLDYWWVHLPGQPLLVLHTGPGDSEIADVSAVELLVPAAGEGLDTFALALITLADLPGVRAAKKSWPWSTHELLVLTIDTTRGPVPFERPLPWRTMQPHNLSAQFQADDDDQARAVLEDVALALVNGLLPAEIQAYVPEREKMMTVAPMWQQWQEVVAATAEHHRTGGTHEEGHP